MKIFLPFKVTDIGGTSTFAKKFKLGMEKLGHEVNLDYSNDYDVMFLIVQCPFKYLFDAKKRGVKIVQRLDGAYHWSVGGWRFPIFNTKAAIIRHFFADYTIYQSQFSRDCVNRFLGPKHHEQSSIIYNGVDTTVFSPVGSRENLRDNSKQLIFLTASAFRHESQIVPIFKSLDYYAKAINANFKLVIAGSFTERLSILPDNYKGRSYVKFVGKVSNEKIANYARSADVFLFTHPNTSCPNNVIEAMACGLPICGIADGAMPELVDKNVGRLMNVSGTGFWRQRKFDVVKFANNLAIVTNNRTRFSLFARKSVVNRYSLQTMCMKYSQVLSNLI